MQFVPLSPAKVRKYVDNIAESLFVSGRPVVKSVSISREIAGRMSMHEQQEADINFWKVVKASIEYVIERNHGPYADESQLRSAYLDLQRLIDWVAVVYGEHWEPKLVVDD